MKYFYTQLLLVLTTIASAQHDSFSISVTTPELGLCDFEFYKYTTRSPTQQVFTWDGTTLTPFTPDPIRTYRGQITNQNNYRAFAVWYPNGEIVINASKGQGQNDDIEALVIDSGNVTITPLSLPIVTAPMQSLKVIKSGYSCTYADVINPEQGNNDYQTLIAMWENGVNLVDYASSRDLGLSLTTDLLIIPTSPTIATKDDIIEPKNYPDQINDISMFWRSTRTSGGGATKEEHCDKPFQGGRASFTRISMPSLHHEFGHTLGLKHHPNERDSMSGDRHYYDRNSAAVAQEHLASIENICLVNNTPSYTDYLHPNIVKDYSIVSINTPTLINVLENDIDYNNDDISLQSFETSSVNGGTISQSGNSLLYTPPANFIGKDSFSYVGQSGSGNGFFTNEAKVVIDVRSSCSLALHYSFEENTGTVVNDLGWQIASQNATLNYVEFSTNGTTGVVGNAIDLPAEDGIILKDILDPLDEDLSISIWFKLHELPDPGEKSMIFDSGARGNLFYQGLSIMIDNNGLHFVAQTESIDGAGAQLDYIPDLSLEQWYHAVMIIDRSSNVLKAYVNGSEVTFSQSNNVDFDESTVIKGYPGYIEPDDPSRNRSATTLGMKTTIRVTKSLFNFNGALDEFKIFTSALSESEVQGLYTNPSDHAVGAINCSTLSSQDVDINTKNDIKIFPNPTNGKLHVISGTFKTIESIKIFSTLGKVLYTATPMTKSELIDLSELSSGVYYIEVITKNRSKEIHKFIVNN
jgi:hypothetical protein